MLNRCENPMENREGESPTAHGLQSLSCTQVESVTGITVTAKDLCRIGLPPASASPAPAVISIFQHSGKFWELLKLLISGADKVLARHNIVHHLLEDFALPPSPNKIAACLPCCTRRS